MSTLKIIDDKVITEEERFTITTFAKAVGVYRATVDYWIKKGKINLDQNPYDVIKQFWEMPGECTRCGKRVVPGMGHRRWCECGEPRLKIGVTYYHNHVDGSDENDGVTYKSPFRTSSKAMCAARKKEDRIIDANRGRENRMIVDFAIDLCKLDIEAIDKEGAADRALLRTRMDTIYVTLKIAYIVIGRDGYNSVDQKNSYRDLRETFLQLQDRYGIFYNNDLI